MQTRPLGTTGLEVPILSFGASSLGQEFRKITIEEAMSSVRVALDNGMRLIDTSPFYGRGMSEIMLGLALKDVPRDDYLLCTKLGRYDVGHFDFSARRVAESIDISLHRLGTDHLDIMLCHDIEFVPMQLDCGRDSSRNETSTTSRKDSFHWVQRIPTENLSFYLRPGRSRLCFKLQPIHTSKHTFY